MNNTSSWLVKSFAIGAAVALATFAPFYGFFAIHKELEVRPATACLLGLLAFLPSAIMSMIYFRTRRALIDGT